MSAPSWIRPGAVVHYQPVRLEGQPWFRGVVDNDPWLLPSGGTVVHLRDMEEAYAAFVGVPSRTRVHAVSVDHLRPARDGAPVLSDTELDRVERESRKDPSCPWSAVKLAMVAEIRAARGGYDLVQHLERQRRFSEQAFGPGSRWRGCVDHIRRELLEVEADPTDLAEWIDVAMLAFDGAWRSGASPHAIAAAFLAKLIKNENRKWPDWRTADPDLAIEHERSAEQAAGGAQ